MKYGVNAIWKAVPNDLKDQIKKVMLFDEQKGLCGYTELPLTITIDSSHFDHFRKRNGIMGQKQTLQLEWTNLIIASVDEDFGAKYKDKHIIVNKTYDDYTIIYNPVEDGMDKDVDYDTDGFMVPKKQDDYKVTRTIDIFYLNNPKLTEKRKKIMQDVKMMYDGGMNCEEIRNIFASEHKGFPSVVEWELKILHKNSLQNSPK